MKKWALLSKLSRMSTWRLSFDKRNHNKNKKMKNNWNTSVQTRMKRRTLVLQVKILWQTSFWNTQTSCEQLFYLHFWNSLKVCAIFIAVNKQHSLVQYSDTRNITLWSARTHVTRALWENFYSIRLHDQFFCSLQVTGTRVQQHEMMLTACIKMMTFEMVILWVMWDSILQCFNSNSEQLHVAKHIVLGFTYLSMTSCVRSCYIRPFDWQYRGFRFLWSWSKGLRKVKDSKLYQETKRRIDEMESDVEL